MIDFDNAIQIAKKKLEELQPDASFIEIEQALINDEKSQYEITFSYSVQREDKLQIEKDDPSSNMAKLSSLLRQRKVYKTFLVNAETGAFRGFRIYQAS